MLIISLRENINAKEAIKKRVIELCEKYNYNINTLANFAGIPPTTIYSIINKKSKNPGIISIKKICDGFGISLREFFNSDFFDDIELEI